MNIEFTGILDIVINVYNIYCIIVATYVFIYLLKIVISLYYILIAPLIIAYD